MPQPGHPPAAPAQHRVQACTPQDGHRDIATLARIATGPIRLPQRSQNGMGGPPEGGPALYAIIAGLSSRAPRALAPPGPLRPRRDSGRHPADRHAPHGPGTRPDWRCRSGRIVVLHSSVRTARLYQAGDARWSDSRRCQSPGRSPGRWMRCDVELRLTSDRGQRTARASTRQRSYRSGRAATGESPIIRSRIRQLGRPTPSPWSLGGGLPTNRERA